MVRIIKEEQPKTQQPLPEARLTEKSKVLLQVIGIVIADKPQAIRELLEDYSVTFEKEPSEKELVDTLLSAIGECNAEFNNDLASIILDCTLENTYDSFDFESMFSGKKKAESGADSSQSSGGSGGGGLWAGIANAVGGIGGAIGQGLKGKQARDQATANTIQGIYAYKSQVAANDRSKGKNKVYMMLALFVVIGLAVTALVYFNRRQQATPSTIPLNT